MNLLSFNIDNSVFNSPFSPGKSGNLSNILGLVLNGGLAIAGVALLIITIGAGFAIISGAGKGKPDDVAKATKVATSAIIGFLIVFGTYLIIQFLGIFLGGSVDLITKP